MDNETDKQKFFSADTDKKITAIKQVKNMCQRLDESVSAKLAGQEKITFKNADFNPDKLINVLIRNVIPHRLNEFTEGTDKEKEMAKPFLHKIRVSVEKLTAGPSA